MGKAVVKLSSKAGPFNLDECAARIRVALKGEATYRLNVGRELITAKEALPHGKFLPWIKAQFYMSERTAQNYMTLAKKAGSTGNADIVKLPVKQAYTATQKKPAGIGKPVTTKPKSATVADLKSHSPVVEDGIDAATGMTKAEQCRVAALDAVDLLKEKLGDGFESFVTLYDAAGDEFTPALHGQ